VIDKKSNILRIGFLNDFTPDKLQIYKTKYDVVILKDKSMEFVYDLLKDVEEI
jgi:hypothetical protein